MIRTGFDKELFVSRSSTWPPVRLPYTDPDDRIAVLVRERAAGGQVLVATLTGRRRPLSGRRLAWMLLRYPFVTLRVTAGIHVQVRAPVDEGRAVPAPRNASPHAVTVIRDSRAAGGS